MAEWLHVGTAREPEKHEECTAPGPEIPASFVWGGTWLSVLLQVSPADCNGRQGREPQGWVAAGSSSVSHVGCGGFASGRRNQPI